MPRLTPIDPADFTPEQQRIAEAIMAGRGGLRGPFLPWMHSPELCDRAQHLGEFCRFNTSLSPFHSEFAIIMTGKYWKAQYEFFAHARMAREAGVSEAVVEAIRLGTEPPFEDDGHRAIYAFVHEYFDTHRVSDTTYARAKAIFGERGVVELVGIVGYYSLVSMTLNVFDVSLPEGEPLPLP